MNDRRLFVTLLIMFCFILSANICHAQITVSFDNLQAIDTGINDYYITERCDGTAVFNGASFFMSDGPGDPALPWQILTVLVPPHTSMESVSLNVLDINFLSIGLYNINPVPSVGTCGQKNDIIDVPGPSSASMYLGNSKNIYRNNQYWPGTEKLQTRCGKLHEWNLLEIMIPLFQYNPVTKDLKRLISINLGVTYTSVKNSSNVKFRVLLGRDRVKKLVCNFQQIAPLYETKLDFQDQNSLNPQGYLILAESAILSSSTALADFIAHKQGLGYSTYVRTEADWGGGTGDSAADNIQAYLADNYSLLDVQYVLLIGNPDPVNGLVPMKMCGEYPTDFYYSDLSGDWDADNDGIFGEWPDDAIVGGLDRYWEVIVGRIPYYGIIDDLDSILLKTMNYETSTDISWRRNVLLPMVPLDDQTSSYQCGEQMKSNILEPSFIPGYRIYAERYSDVTPPPESLLHNDYPATVWAEGKYGLVVWSTHGWEQGAAEVIDTSDVPGLNDSVPSVTWQGSCGNAWPEDANNLAYALLRHGCIGTNGATRISGYYLGVYDYVNSPTAAGMGYLYAQFINDGQSTGEAIANVKQGFLPEGLWLNFLVFNLYGDPSVNVFGPPPDLAVTPTDLFYNSGPFQGPLSFSERQYTLYNTTSSPISWSVSNESDWLGISPENGIIPADSSANVITSVTSLAFNLPIGEYSDNLVFHDITHGDSVPRSAVLNVNSHLMACYYRLDETMGTVAIDSSGNAFNGTLVNGFTFLSNSVSGQFNRGLYFDGVYDLIELPEFPIPPMDSGTNCLTISAWINKDGDQNWSGIVFNREDGTIAGLGVGPENDLRYHWNGDPATFNWDSDFLIPDNQWVFVAMVIKPWEATLYFYDGTLISAVNTMDHPLQGFSGTTTIGADSANKFRRFKGSIDDVRIYNYSLTLNEIQTLISGGKAENPFPRDQVQNALPQSVLQWVGAANTDIHNVYLGKDYNDVLNATPLSPSFMGTRYDTFYNPILSFPTDYYWRVDELSIEFGTVTGNVWSFTTGFDLIETDRIIYYSMDTADITGPVVHNLSGDAQYNGTIFGDPLEVTGILNEALCFDGTDDYIETPPLHIDSNTVTITAWIKRDGIQASRAGIIYNTEGSTIAGLTMGPGGTDLRYRWNNQGPNFSSGLTIPDDEWAFIALVILPYKTRLYVNLDFADHSKNNDPEEFDGITSIGRDASQSDRYFKGAMRRCDDLGPRPVTK